MKKCFVYLVLLLVFTSGLAALSEKKTFQVENGTLLLEGSASGRSVKILVVPEQSGSFMDSDAAGLFKNTRLDKVPVEVAVASVTFNFNAPNSLPRHLFEEVDFGFGVVRNAVFKVGGIKAAFPEPKADIILGGDFFQDYIIEYLGTLSKISFLKRTEVSAVGNRAEAPSSHVTLDKDASLSAYVIFARGGKTDGRIYFQTREDGPESSVPDQNQLRALLFPLAPGSDGTVSGVTVGGLFFPVEDLLISKQNPQKIFLSPRMVLGMDWTLDIKNRQLRLY